MAGQARPAHGRRDRPPHRHRRTDARHRGGPLHRGRAPAAPRSGGHRRARRGPHAAPADVPHHQRHRPRAHRGRPEGRGPRPGQRLPGHPAAGRLQDPDPPRPPQGRPRGAPGRPRDRPHPGQGQHRPDAGPERGRGPRPAVLGRGARLRTALHRADAPGRPARLEARQHGHRRGHPRLPAHPLRPHPRGRRHARLGPGGALAGERRPAPGRRHRLGHPPVLRGL